MDYLRTKKPRVHYISPAFHQAYEDAKVSRDIPSDRRPRFGAKDDIESSSEQPPELLHEDRARIPPTQSLPRSMPGQPPVGAPDQYAKQLMLDSAFPHIFYTITERIAHGRTRPLKFVLNIAGMQAYALRLCQMRIIEAAEGLQSGRVDPELTTIIHSYCEALRDMDYMEEKAKNGFDADPFLLTTSAEHERLMMQRSGLLNPHKPVRLDVPEDRDHPRLPGVGRTARIHSAKQKEKLYNVLSALIGGLALLIPMIIMKLVPGRICSLSTTSGCVLAFALVAAFWSNLKQSEILTITAAYAAVLVVFVGNNNNNGPGGGGYSK